MFLEKFSQYDNVEVVGIESISKLLNNTFYIDWSVGWEGESARTFKISYLRRDGI